MKLLHGTALKRFLRDWRRANPPAADLALVLHSVSYPVNVGSLFRIADAANVSQVILCGATPLPETQTIRKVARGKQSIVPWVYQERVEEALEELRRRGYCLIALELTDQSRPYYLHPYPQRVALVVGNEDHGVTRSALAVCDASVFVPMYGRGHSLNVHVSAAIVLFHILHQQGAG